jgi:ABC-type multidrug transport system fused ATPase/permease subunit
MIAVSHHLDIVNYVDSVIFIDRHSRRVTKDTHQNLMKNVNYASLFKN